MEEDNNKFFSPSCVFDQTAIDILEKYYCAQEIEIRVNQIGEIDDEIFQLKTTKEDELNMQDDDINLGTNLYTLQNNLTDVQMMQTIQQFINVFAYSFNQYYFYQKSLNDKHKQSHSFNTGSNIQQSEYVSNGVSTANPTELISANDNRAIEEDIIKQSQLEFYQSAERKYITEDQFKELKQEQIMSIICQQFNTYTYKDDNDICYILQSFLRKFFQYNDDYQVVKNIFRLEYVSEIIFKLLLFVYIHIFSFSEREQRETLFYLRGLYRENIEIKSEQYLNEKSVLCQENLEWFFTLTESKNNIAFIINLLSERLQEFQQASDMNDALKTDTYSNEYHTQLQGLYYLALLIQSCVCKTDISNDLVKQIEYFMIEQKVQLGILLTSKLNFLLEIIQGDQQ